MYIMSEFRNQLHLMSADFPSIGKHCFMLNVYIILVVKNDIHIIHIISPYMTQ